MDDRVIFDLFKRGMSISKITNELYRYKNRYNRDKYFTGEGIEYKKWTKEECKKKVYEVILKRL